MRSLIVYPMNLYCLTMECTPFMCSRVCTSRESASSPKTSREKSLLMSLVRWQGNNLKQRCLAMSSTERYPLSLIMADLDSPGRSLRP